ncbi:MAG TPA: hypothetical protein VLH85_00760, partial [Levilinea sp.]|nr:hypothetical protein [Levilinea sp.]
TPTPSSMHVGDLDVTKTTGGINNWDATVTMTIHNSNHLPLASVRVNFSWTDGPGTVTGECMTNSAGMCSTTSRKNGTSPKTLVVTNLTGTLPYSPSNNHDPDGDSNGTRIIRSAP